MAHADLDDDESARPAPPPMSRESQSIADHAGADGMTAHRYGTLVFAAGAVLLLPAVWSFFSAVWSAMTTGQGPDCADRVGGFSDSRPQPSLVASRRVSVVGLALLLFSRWFTSLGGAALFTSMAAYIALAAFVDRKFGRGAATAMLLATVALIVYVYVSK
ncbi:hypothetical protein [Variovorax guangxiensis]|uniref:hypothetical protein n=1 Tax=Variovorax guangxiensis TaxID=1775474 RepID=UPI0028541CD9|nr:hypothetical protein [Variovorax guangxiensis]MDR6860867.1 hypothetical protein [Variovorax guangxiensis]